MNEILGQVTSLLNTLGLLPYVQAMIVIALVGGFIAVVFRK